MITISHQGVAEHDLVEVEAHTPLEALSMLLNTRGVAEVAALEPAVIETRWC